MLPTCVLLLRSGQYPERSIEQLIRVTLLSDRHHVGAGISVLDYPAPQRRARSCMCIPAQRLPGFKQGYRGVKANHGGWCDGSACRPHHLRTCGPVPKTTAREWIWWRQQCVGRLNNPVQSSFYLDTSASTFACSAAGSVWYCGSASVDPRPVRLQILERADSTLVGIASAQHP